MSLARPLENLAGGETGNLEFYHSLFSCRPPCLTRNFWAEHGIEPFRSFDASRANWPNRPDNWFLDSDF